jgi:peptidyl-tRNA hydrolase
MMDKGSINVGKYDDGSGPVATVDFDVHSQYTPRSVWVNMGSTWIAVKVEHIDELCRAIKRAAKHIRAAHPMNNHEGVV